MTYNLTKDTFICNQMNCRDVARNVSTALCVCTRIPSSVIRSRSKNLR